MMRLCVLGANARFPTEFDGKGNGPTRLAGHMLMVGTHEAICNMPRQRPAGGSCNRMCLVCQFWFISCVAVCSCTKQTDVMLSVSSGAGSREYQEMRNVLRLRQVAASGYFVANNLSHAQLGHTESFTHIKIWQTHLSHTHTQLYRIQLFAYNFSNFSILHHLLCLSFLPRTASTLSIVSAFWKKLTCGVIRSLN